ncbi:hypothetical protein [Dactylosporangium sp. CA-092794]|uniref:hypothetical protein n=1 Tax=Dactylosporangium sp. CA-092794 TaxID=3239929 RepID=UPI003D90BB7C
MLLGVVTGGGRETLTQLFAFMLFYCGVFTLVSLTMCVIAGLLATDRIILVARHRVWVQSVHRTLGIVAVSFLGLHIGSELVSGRVGIFGALVPFTTAPFAVGAGTIAAYLMVTVMWTGMVRARFAQTGKPWMWRPLHATAYLSWPVAVWHGLNAGRPAAVWVTASYVLLLFLTLVALGLRLSAERNRKQQQLAADRTTTEIAPVGRPEPAGYDRRATRSSRSGSRFRWDAPAAEQLWDADAANLRADYRRETAEPEPADYRREAERPAAAPVTAVPFEPPFEKAYDEDRYTPDAYATEYYEKPEPTTYRGTATPKYDDGYDPYATYPEPYAETYQEPAPRHSTETAGMTLRDRFEARRSKVSAAAEPDRYVDDDTPTLVNLDTRRELRRQEREQAQAGRGRRHRAEDDDVEYWNRLRGEAR